VERDETAGVVTGGVGADPIALDEGDPGAERREEEGREGPRDAAADDGDTTF
jgi:hypothetical protein